MNHITDLTDEDLYDAIQTGEIPNVKMGDTINGKLLIVDKLGNYTEMEPGVTYYQFTETVRNNSTKHDFVDTYIAKERCPLSPTLTHLEVLSVESTPLN